MEMWGKRNEGTRAGGHVRRQRGLVMGRGQSMGRRKGWEKQRERDEEGRERDGCFKEISFFR